MADYSPPSPRPPSHLPPSPLPPSHQRGGGNTPPLRYSGDQYKERQRQDYGYTSQNRPDQYRGPSDNYYTQQYRGPDHSRGSRQYSDYYRGPGHYDDDPKGSEHYSDRGSRHYTIPGPYREQPRGPGQYDDSPREPGPYREQPRGPGQYEDSPRDPGPYREQPRGYNDHYCSSDQQYKYTSKTLPHKLYSGPVLPSSSSQRNVDRSQSVIERKVSGDERRPQAQYKNIETRYESNLQTEPRYGSHGDLQTQYKGQYYRQHKTSDSTDSSDQSPAKKELFTDPPPFIKTTPRKTEEYNYQTPVTPVTSTSSNVSSSSDPKSPLTPPIMNTSTDEREDILTEINHQKEIKSRLIQEVIRLEGQKKMIQEELSVLKEEEKHLSLNVNKFMEEESIVKVRLEQAVQNMELADEIAKQEQQKKLGGQQNGTASLHPSPSFECELQKEREKIKELEMTLRDRESQIKKKEMELEMESDMLYQRSKELKLKEYDMKNGGTQTGPGSGGVKEREIYEKQLELDEREASLNSREQSLSRRESEFQIWERKRRHSLEQWAQNVQEEDKRAMENIKKASQMFDEANNLRDQVLGAAQAADLEEKQRTERLLSNASSQGGGVTSSIDSEILLDTSKDTPPSGATEDRKPLVKAYTISSSASPPVIPYLPQKSHSVDDREVALTLLRELNEEIRKDDEKFIEELCKEEESKPPATPQTLSPEEEKRQMKMNFGLSPDATDEELDKKIKELQG